MGVRDRPLLRILVADHHPIFRAGIKALLSETSSWQRFEVGEAESTEEAFALIASGGFSVVLMDYNLPGRGGIKAVEIIRSRWPAIAVIALTDTDDGERAERIVKAGAKGCILRNVGLDTLLGAIRTVLAGGVFYSNEIAQQLLGHRAVAAPDPLERLTPKEKEVFLSILRGSGDREIAAQLGIAKRTVDKHRQHINYKLGTRSLLELLQAGLRLGLVKVPE
jgi:DNA-binding NarL/FixJ family response regulator